MVQYITADISLFENSIKRLFNRQPFGRFLSDRKIEKTGALQYEWNSLADYTKRGRISGV